MQIERWQQIDRLFHLALEHEPDRRGVFLEQACAGDEILISEVQELISFHEQAESFIENPASDLAAGLLARGQAELTVGEAIGPYRIDSVLGIGGMGEVYLALDTRLSRQVALKLLPPQFTLDPERVRRFEQESRAASALNHPNIVTIYEIGRFESTQFIVTEFIHGQTLRQLKNEKPFTLNEALNVAIQVAEALTAAHSAGIVHRDIKPENIMLRTDGYVKILDFGLAKLTEAAADSELETSTLLQSSPGMVMGTVQYMSPEQARGKKVDSRTDIWSLGVVLYELLTGRVPFEGKTPSHVMVSLMEDELPPLTSNANVPAELERIVNKALRKIENERYQTAQSLALDLKNLKQELQLEGRLKGSGEVADVRVELSERRDWPLRRSSFAAIGVIALVAALALSYTYFFSARSIHSIAVMPFANESGDPNVEYLSDGVTGNLIESLSKVPDLQVKAHSTVVRYKGANSDARRIGQELNVEAVLFGRLIETGEDLTLQVELVDSRNGNNLWRQTYQKKVSGLVVLQSELARDLAGKLSVPITDKTREKLAKHDTENSDAKLLYLKGVVQARKLTEQDIKKAIDLFWQAIQKDPEYAKAYAAIASAHRSLTMCCDGHPSESLKGKVAALKAVQLDPELAEGHSALASLIYAYDWNWAEAEKEFLRALELDPNSSMAHFSYGDFLGPMGRRQEASVQGDRARELEPYSPFFNTFGAGRDPEKAVERIRFAIDLDPNFYFSHLIASGIYRERKRYAEAIEEARLAKALSPDQTWSDANLSSTFVDAGRPEEARAILDQLLLRSKSRYVPPYHIALVYNNLGDKEQALDWLEKAYAIRDPKMTFLKTPNWKNVENDPRFQDILRRVGFVGAK